MKEALTERAPSGGSCTASSRLTRALRLGMPIHSDLTVGVSEDLKKGTPHADCIQRMISYSRRSQRGSSALPQTEIDISERQRFTACPLIPGVPTVHLFLASLPESGPPVRRPTPWPPHLN